MATKKKAPVKKPAKKKTKKKAQRKTKPPNDGILVLSTEDITRLENARLSTELARVELVNLAYEKKEWERAYLERVTSAKTRLSYATGRQQKLAASVGEKYDVDMTAHGYDDVTGVLKPLG